MVVVIAIIMIITAIVISGQSNYNQTLVLTDTAYTVAFSVRQAQSLGLSSRSARGVTDAGYGIHAGNLGDYTLFADTERGLASPGDAWCPLGLPGTPEAKPGNCRYDAGQDQIVQTFTFERGFTMSDVCVKNGTSALDCSVTGVDIVFMRPETRAVITAANGASYTCAELHIAAPGNAPIATRVVRVSQLGEISVGQSCL
jgi:hypothetical protein